jgi:tRNA pseudouridine38-40 synthase
MDAGVRRLALLLEYDGSAYAGSQLQQNGPSIQGELERAITATTGAFTRVAFAGRTDAGVHASGQVAAFDTPAAYSLEAFRGGLNVRLPATIAVRAVAEVAAGFDPRRRAVARRYRYAIFNGATRSPLLRERAWHVRASLDERLMQQAAELLIGEKDFAAFASVEASRASTWREIRGVQLQRCGCLVSLEIEANAFLMHQVRRTVAALVEVGTRRRGVADFEHGLSQAQPGSFALSAPPQGLCLMHVRYEPAIFDEE